MSDKRATTAAGPPRVTRRDVILGAGAAALSLSLAGPRAAAAGANEKLDIGFVGCGGRGSWIADLFRKHGGYNIVAAADYFQDRVDAFGQEFAIPANRRFTTLSGYKRLLEQKLDAVVIESPPYFHPEQAAAGIAAGKHVYLAKPVAVDVPGCQTIEATGKAATDKKLCFLVDFQTRAHDSYREVAKRVHEGGIGKIVSCDASYACGPTFTSLDQLLRKSPTDPETRLRAWGIDKRISGDIITEQNIHAIDVACWMLNGHPEKAYGTGGRTRDFIGDCWDHFAVIYQFPKGVFTSFNSKQVGGGFDDIQCRVYGDNGTADTHYFGKVVLIGDDPFNGGTMTNLYTEGAVRNIGDFHKAITQGPIDNSTVAASVASNLTTILGRTAAYKGAEVTWDEMMRTAEKLDPQLGGLKQ